MTMYLKKINGRISQYKKKIKVLNEELFDDYFYSKLVDIPCLLGKYIHNLCKLRSFQLSS